MKCALSIAGSDPSGGAGMQADLKTMTLNGVYAMGVITALTAQNTTGVKEILQIPDAFFEKQLESVLSDIMPDAVKIGMMGSENTVKITARLLKKYGARNIVVDPVFVSTSGKDLYESSAREELLREIFPAATLITPNLSEAEYLTGETVQNAAQMERASRLLYEKYGCAVLLKGGHLTGGADDLLYFGENFEWLKGERILNPNTHGTGCTLSSAIAANLAKGFSLSSSARLAKEYVAGAIGAGLDLGKGRGPLHHAFDIDSRFLKAAENME